MATPWRSEEEREEYLDKQSVQEAKKPRYIDANELIANLVKFDYEHFSELTRMLIEKQPTADVVEQKHGYWIKNQYISKVIGIPVKKEFVFICSLCGHNAIGKSKYCRECGADMRGAK